MRQSQLKKRFKKWKFVKKNIGMLHPTVFYVFPLHILSSIFSRAYLSAIPISSLRERFVLTAKLLYSSCNALSILIVLHHSFYTHPYSYLNSSFRTVLCILSYAYYILPKTDSSQKAFPKMIFRTFLFSTMAFGETVEFLKPA